MIIFTKTEAWVAYKALGDTQIQPEDMSNKSSKAVPY